MAARREWWIGNFAKMCRKMWELTDPKNPFLCNQEKLLRYINKLNGRPQYETYLNQSRINLKKLPTFGWNLIPLSLSTGPNNG